MSHDFKEPEPGSLINAFNLKPKDAINLIKGKGVSLAWSWKDVQKDSVTKSFSVAKAMKEDILLTIKDHLQMSLEEGWTFKQFQKTITPVLQKKGWWGKVPDALVPTDGPLNVSGKMVQLGSPWRLRTIFKTNMQSAMMSGRFKAMKATAKYRPYWQYIAINDASTRPEHSALHGRIFRHDDPIWQKIFPPNGFNCRCSVRTLSDRELERKGLIKDVEESNNGKIYDVHGQPIEPDEGFAHNPGEVGVIELDKLYQKKLKKRLKETKELTGYVRPTLPEEEVYAPRVVADPEEIAPQILPTPKEIALRKKINKDNAEKVALVDKVHKALPELVKPKAPIPEIDDLLHKVDIHKKEPTWDLKRSKTQKQRYGGVLINDEGKILLRRPTGDFDGYVWTFAKGGEMKSKKPIESAKKEVLEETGWETKTIGILPGGYGKSKNNFFFLMKGDKHLPDLMDNETQELKWVTPKEAVEHISQTTNKAGRFRDMQVLISAVRTYNGLAEGRINYNHLSETPKQTFKPAALPAGDFPKATGQLETIRHLGGSTGAKLVKDPETGKKYVLKTGASADHVREEYHADKIYRELGVKVPDCRLYEENGKTFKLSEYIENTKPLAEVIGKPGFDKVKKQLHKGFAADAFLGNWDVVGLGFDNILIDEKGNAWRIDNGGSLRFRAQGAKKGADDWNEYAGELWTLRGKAWETKTDKDLFSSSKNLRNRQTETIFGDIGIVEISRQVESWDIERLAKAFPADSKELLTKRLKHMRDIAKRALDFNHDRWVESYIEDIGQGSMALRKFELLKVLPKEMSQDADGVYLKDEKGQMWDKLVTNLAKEISNNDPYYEPLLKAAKTIGYHVKKGDRAFNLETLSKAEAVLEKLKGESAEIKKHYGPFSDYLSKAINKVKSGDTPDLPIKLKAAPQKLFTATDNEGATHKLKRLADELGVDLSIISEWQTSQGGNSWGDKALVKKYHNYLNTRIDEQKIFWRGHKESAKQKYQEAIRSNPSLDLAMKLHHATVQEILFNTEFKFNDQERRCLRIMRTENSSNVVERYGLKKGKEYIFARGLNESGAIYKPVEVGGTQMTIGAVPYSRITGLYFWESPVQMGKTPFYSVGENEITHFTPDLPVKHLGRGYYKDLDLAGKDGGKYDASKWGVTLDHLR